MGSNGFIKEDVEVYSEGQDYTAINIGPKCHVFRLGDDNSISHTALPREQLGGRSGSMNNFLSFETVTAIHPEDPDRVLLRVKIFEERFNQVKEGLERTRRHVSNILVASNGRRLEAQHIPHDASEETCPPAEHSECDTPAQEAAQDPDSK